MDVSIFSVLGPVMIGPSSSHTAGAARLSKAAARIAGAGSRVLNAAAALLILLLLLYGGYSSGILS